MHLYISNTFFVSLQNYQNLLLSNETSCYFPFICTRWWQQFIPWDQYCFKVEFQMSLFCNHQFFFLMFILRALSKQHKIIVLFSTLLILGTLKDEIVNFLLIDQQLFDYYLFKTYYHLVLLNRSRDEIIHLSINHFMYQF